MRRKRSGNARTGTVSRNTVWIANQMARFKITPTTAAVRADKAAFSDLLPRSFSTNGAPRKIHRKHGVNVTQVASKPPSVPASMGDSPPGSRNAAMKPTNCSTMIKRPGRGLGHAEAIQHLAGFQPAVVLDRLLRDIGEHRIGAAERHHRHLAEEDSDLAEDVGAAQSSQQCDDGDEPQRQPYR